jgi:hypothetical protein
MSVTSTHPHSDQLTPIQEAAVRAELEAVLKSPHFASSKRCHDLLEFVVNGALQRDFDNLSERFIGASVFGRPIEYETATDAIVRVRANDVRRRLAQYYLELKKPSTVRIGLNSGSYIPEFHFPSHKGSQGENGLHAENHAHRSVEAEEPEDAPRPVWRQKKWLLPGVAVALCLLAVAGFLVIRSFSPKSQVERFWNPILRNKGDILICAGGNTFQQTPVPGFITAGKEIDYPYFSLQTEVSTTLLSTLIERRGATPQFRFAATTPLPEFHEHPIILLNAYNNQWTLRLTEPLRFYFSPELHAYTSTDLVVPHPQSILDHQDAKVAWHRDATRPYENTDDYAILARFWDKTTENWVIVLAGLGRNGTEAATRFAVDPSYLQGLRDRLGSDFGDRNIEVVLRAQVVDGKTGSPQIMAVHAW